MITGRMEKINDSYKNMKRLKLLLLVENRKNLLKNYLKTID